MPGKLIEIGANEWIFESMKIGDMDQLHIRRCSTIPNWRRLFDFEPSFWFVLACQQRFDYYFFPSKACVSSRQKPMIIPSNCFVRARTVNVRLNRRFDEDVSTSISLQ